ncbi:MAG TPA: pentapeptide repeat-containing protein [Candidatus Baltobacteraceae bacterium]|nr:pentapeptide repeat-containing protein [Candidatus Baltobacteraceae bacterium]
MIQRLPKLSADLPEVHKPKGTERLATAEELAEIGGGSVDPAEEAQILSLLEVQMKDDLQKAAVESAVQARQAALQELVAALEPELLEAAEKSPGSEKMKAAAEPQPAAKMPANAAGILSEPERVAAAFFGAEEETPVQAPMAAQAPREVQAPVATKAPIEVQKLIDAPAPVEAQPRAAEPLQAEIVAEFAPEYAPEFAVASETGIVAIPREEAHDLKTELLQVAEALDQHRLWVESNGEQGIRGDFAGANLSDADLTGVNLQGADLTKVNLRGADLSMANLRGANLVEADLRETNLLGAEFSGANLMGANLYGAQGLWAGRLGGTNLFDATLPEAVGAYDGGKTIGQFTQAARRFYLLVIAICIGACAMVALTRDVRLLLDESAMVLARIPNLLPLQGFYMGAPLLLTALYLRLQFLLLRLWGSMGALPAVFPDGQTPEKDGSWYLMGPIRQHLRWTRDPRSPLAMVECRLAKLLAYWAVPVTVFLFWLRYLVMQDYRGTLLQVFLLTLVASAGFAMPKIVARVLRPGDWTDESTPQFVRDVASAFRVPVLVGMVVFLMSLGVIRGLPADANARPDIGRGDPRRWAATAFQALGYRPYADVTEESISTSAAKPVTDGETGTGSGPRLNEINLRYSRGYRSQFAGARMWRANLEGSSLSEADFRAANLREAVLRGANLDRLQAAKANLVSADAQGAQLAGADFRNADLSYANLDGAKLTTANFGRATLYAVKLRNADLLRAELSHADLRDVKLDDAVLSMASMEMTDFSAAKMMGVNLTGAQAKGTIFLEADMSRADLRGASFPGAILRDTKLDGARVEGADFRGALGLEAWQVCSTTGWQGAQFDADVKAAVLQTCGGALQGRTQP